MLITIRNLLEKKISRVLINDAVCAARCESYGKYTTPDPPLSRANSTFSIFCGKTSGFYRTFVSQTNRYTLIWMMVIVPRIAVVSCLSATPFIYGIRQEASDFPAALSLLDIQETVRAFAEGRADIALVPAGAVPHLSGARIVTEYCIGGVAAELKALQASSDPLVEAWKPYGKLPCAFALWVARAEVAPETVESLRAALTRGLERPYEALLDSPWASDAGAAYAELARFDYIFDNQKDKALKKFWDSGLKVAPRTNPG